MTNTTQTLKRAAGIAGVIGAAVGLSAVPAATAATSYATGWQCISPFINSFGTPSGGVKGDVMHVPEGASEGFLDSLDIQIARNSNALTAVKGQPLYLDGTNLSVEFKHPSPLQTLWRRTGGVSMGFNGTPGWANVPATNAGTATWVDADLGTPNDNTIPTPDADAVAAGVQPFSISVRTKPADGQAYWSYAVGTGANQVIHYAPEAIGTQPLNYASVAAPKFHPSYVNAAKASASLGHTYLANRNNNNFPITSYVTIEGTNTAEKFQTVRVDGYWTVNVLDPTPGSPQNTAGYADGNETVTAPKRTFALPASKWTPTGDGPVEFRIAPPGNASTIEVESKGYDRAGYNRPIRVKPFGSVYVRAETRSYASTNDCVNGTVGIKNAAISTGSNAGFIGNSDPNPDAPENLLLGDAEFPGQFIANNSTTTPPTFNTNSRPRGAAGRYETTQAVQPTFAKADLPAAAPAPQPVPVPAAPVALKAEVLGVKKNKTNVAVSNNGTAETEYTVTAVTKNKYKVGKKKSKKKSKKTLSVAPTKIVKVKPGQTVNAPLSVKKDVRTQLKSKSIDIIVTITPKGGAAIKYTVKLTLL